MRWKYFVPGLAVLLILFLLDLLFLDAFLKRSLIAAGEYAFEAKVEIADLSVRFRDLSLDIQGIRVADKTRPMTNLFQMDAIRFEMEPIPLLSKKTVINEMVLEGLRWGTVRERSGALSPSRLRSIKRRKLLGPGGIVARLSERLEAVAAEELASLPAWKTVQALAREAQRPTLKGLVKAADLQIFDRMVALVAEGRKKIVRYQEDLEALDVQEKIQAVAAATSAVQNLRIETPQDAVEAQKKIAALQLSLENLRDLAEQLSQLEARAQADFEDPEALLRRINQWKERDLRALAKNLELPVFGFSQLTEALIGPAWARSLQRLLLVIQLARARMPSRAAGAKKIVRDRRQGLDVAFPGSRVPPDFLIRRIRVTGSTGGPGKRNEAFDFFGEARNLTSDPRRLGLPMLATLAGSQGGKRFSAAITLDHTQAVARDVFLVRLQGLAASGLNLPASDYLPSFQKGTVDIANQLTIVDSRLEASLEASLQGLDAPGPSTSAPGVSRLVQTLWSGIGSLKASGRVAGTPESLKFELATNADKVLSRRMQAILGENLVQLQAQLRSEINRVAAPAQTETLRQEAAMRNEVLSMIASRQQAVRKQIQAAENAIRKQQGTGLPKFPFSLP